VPPATQDWSTYQLAEFMGAVSVTKDESSALRVAIERAAEALQAEVGAVVFLGVVRASIGFSQAGVPEAELVAVAEGRRSQIHVPGAGDSHAVAVPLEGQPPGWMVFARSAEAFDAGERALLRGMVRVLALTQRMFRVVDGERKLREKSQHQARQNAELLGSLQERQRLLERLMLIQRMISHRTPADQVFDAITQGARDLLEANMVGLLLLDRNEPERLLLVATSGVDEETAHATRTIPVGVGAAGRAVSEERLIMIEDYPASADAVTEYAGQGVKTAMGAPVHDNGVVIGSLVVASQAVGHTYSLAEQDVLLACAEHVSLTLPYADGGQPSKPELTPAPLR
jgi:GAF domain-containing protein